MPCVYAYHLGTQVTFPQEVYPWHAENSSYTLELLQEERSATALELTEQTCGDLGPRSRLVNR
jgi:hypothetical protein